MSQYLRGNEKSQRTEVEQASLFAQEVLPHIGGSCVYIEPKKAKKLIDTEEIK